MIKRAIIRVLRMWLKTAGLYLVRLPRPPSVEDHIFQTFPENQRVSFIQVGAHDGTQNDPISFFRNRPLWRGLLLEPNPPVFRRLEINLAGSPNCKALNVAISESGEPMPFYKISAAAKCREPFWADQVSSLDRSHVETMLQKFGHTAGEAAGMVEKVEVPTRTFNQLLDEQKWQQVDLLFIDAEGMDFRLLRTFPFDRTQPRMLVFEHAHLRDDELAEVKPFLTARSYVFLPVGEDIVAVTWPPHSSAGVEQIALK